MIKKICTLGAAVPKPCALGLVCGPIPLLVGILFGSKVFQYLIQNKIDKIIKSDKYSLEEKINLGITDKKLKIIVDGIDSDFVNDSEKVKQALSEIERIISYWKKINSIGEIEVICVLPEIKVGKSVQLEVLFFSQKLAETLKSKIKIIEKQFFYDIQPEIAESEVEEKLKQKLKTEIGLSCKIVISSDGKIQFR
nr:hypothetical protein [uncultured Treponema sp.]